jgi:hypothetical protein
MSDPRAFDAPEGDYLEQSTSIDEEPETPGGPVPLEANEADVTEQEMEVGLDEEEYR